MLPGYVSGFYTHDECHIDLAQLSTFAQARLVHATAEGLDIKVGRPCVKHFLVQVQWLQVTELALSLQTPECMH